MYSISLCGGKEVVRIKRKTKKLLSGGSQSGHFNLWIWSDDKKKIPLTARTLWNDNAHIFQQCQEQILHGMVMKLKELMSMKNVFFTAHFIETEFSWLSARCFCMWKLLSREETNFFRIDGKEKSSPAFLPDPSSQYILRYYSSLRKHCHLFPHVYAIEASLEWKVIDLCQWRTLSTPIKLLGKWNKTKQ